MTHEEAIAAVEAKGYSRVRVGVGKPYKWIEGWRGERYFREAVSHKASYAQAVSRL